MKIKLKTLTQTQIMHIFCYGLFGIMLIILIVGAIVTSFRENKIVITKTEYNELLSYKDEVETYIEETNKILEARKNLNLNGSKYDEETGLYSMPKSKYDIVQENINTKFFHRDEEILVYRTSALECNESALYEVFYEDLAKRYSKKRDSEVEEKLNQLCLDIKLEWLINGYTKDVHVVAYDYNNTEVAIVSSHNGVIDYNILEPPIEVIDEYFQ